VDLQRPLRSIVPSLDWAVLEMLSSTESGLGSSQIARLSNEGSRSGQVPILDRLVRHGLVIAEPANQGFLYRLNRDHLLAPLILQAAGGGFGGRRPPPAAVTTYLRPLFLYPRQHPSRYSP
jgi:hypothetical protein